MATTKRKVKTVPQTSPTPAKQPQPKIPPETPDEFYAREIQRPKIRELMERLARL